MKCLITGVNGQDGSYLAELMLEKGYEVHGMVRHQSRENLCNIEHIKNDIIIRKGDLTDETSIKRLVQDKFDEIYNLGAMSFVKESFNIPAATFKINAQAVIIFLDAIKSLSPYTKFYQASTSEMFGGLKSDKYNENSAFYPRSPYGVAKLAAHWSVINYRESYDLMACSGILFNHESQRRPKIFVTSKITEWAKRLSTGDNTPLEIGNMEARRDWSHAKDMVEGMWRILNQREIRKDNKPMQDYVLSSNRTTSVREFIESAIKLAGKKFTWVKGDKPEDEVGMIEDKPMIKVNPAYYRPTEVYTLLGDSRKARSELGWSPMYDLDALINEMMA